MPPLVGAEKYRRMTQKLVGGLLFENPYYVDPDQFATEWAAPATR